MVVIFDEAFDGFANGGRERSGWVDEVQGNSVLLPIRLLGRRLRHPPPLRIRPRRDLRRSPRRLRFLPGSLDAPAPPAGRAPLARRRGEASHVADADSRESGAMPGGVRVIENDGSNAELELEVGRVVDRLRRGRNGWWRWYLWGLPPVAGIVVAAVVCTNW